MKQRKEEWVVGLDEDHFNCDDTYPSKEEAIKAGQEELMNAEPYNPESYTSYSEVFMMILTMMLYASLSVG